jgi:hypothetical protein
MLISKVTNMESTRTGNKVANQFIIMEKGEGWNGNFISRKTFQSYDSVIAIKTTWEDGTQEVELDPTYWNYSRTTSKYRSQFLHETTEETKKKIESGEYKYSNLNK